MKIKRAAFLVTANIMLCVILDIVLGSFIIRRLNRNFYSRHVQQELMNANRTYDPLYHHGFIPNSHIPEYIWHGNNYPIFVNSLGLRDSAIRTIPPRSNNTRILLLGDSYIEGVGYSYEKTVAGLLTSRLRISNVEILNAGVQSYSPKLYLSKAKFLLEKMDTEIDRVIIFLDLSDIHNEYYAYRQFSPSDNSDVLGEQTQAIAYSAQERIIGYIAEHSLIGNVIYDYAMERPRSGERPEFYPYELDYQAWTYDKEQYNNYGEEGLKLCRDNMSELIDFLHNKNIRDIALAVYPWPQQIEQKDLDSLQVRYWRDFSESEGIYFINLFPDFFKRYTQKSDFFLPDDHWNEAGNKLVADLLLDTEFFMPSSTPSAYP